MRVGANVLVGGGASAGDKGGCPGRRNRGGFAGLPCNDGCNKSLPGLPGLAGFGGWVCAMAAPGNKPMSKAAANPAMTGAQQRRLKRALFAPKAHTSATVRVTSEAAKANHRWGAKKAARRLSPCGNRAITDTGCRAGPDG